jgi:hypothetical protein
VWGVVRPMVSQSASVTKQSVVLRGADFKPLPRKQSNEMRTTLPIRLFVPVILILTGWFSSIVRADTGIIVYSSKGVDARRTGTGHLALLVTDLCAKGIDQVRECAPTERRGVVITRYGDLAPDYEKTVFAAPAFDQFMATDNPDFVPLLSSGAILKAMQMEYWRKHLRPYLPPLSKQRYAELQFERKKFDAGRTVRQLLTLEFIGSMLSARKKSDSTEPIALMDPDTQELIPDGRWREVIGAEHVRDSIVITAPASPAQEMRLVDYINQMQFRPFNVLSDNCSDFVKGALLTVFGDSKPHFRPRALDLADAWITSPISVASDFLSFTRKNKIPIQVSFRPMMAGTRRATSFATSVSRGALVPNPSQGKIALSLKIYINVLNPLLGGTALAVDKASRFADLPRLVHERGSNGLSQLANEVTTGSTDSHETTRLQQRERIRIFGTQPCWEVKKTQFATLASQAEEIGVLTRYERYLMLRQGRPFLLPRFYEHEGLTGKGSLMAGMQESLFLEQMKHGMFSFMPPEPEQFVTELPPGRSEIRASLASHQEMNTKIAFKLMAAVINYDLSSEPAHRRSVQAFDQDWRLFLDVAQENGLRTQTEDLDGRTLELCSCREFEERRTHSDALAQGSTVFHRLAQEGRELLFGPIR